MAPDDATLLPFSPICQRVDITLLLPLPLSLLLRHCFGAAADERFFAPCRLRCHTTILPTTLSVMNTSLLLYTDIRRIEKPAAAFSSWCPAFLSPFSQPLQRYADRCCCYATMPAFIDISLHAAAVATRNPGATNRHPVTLRRPPLFHPPPFHYAARHCFAGSYYCCCAGTPYALSADALMLVSYALSPACAITPAA